MAVKKPGGSKAENVAAPADVIVIRWFKTAFTKYAGNTTISTYADPETKRERVLRDPENTDESGLGRPKNFTIQGGKDLKLKMTNSWHKAVYEFIIGDTKPGGRWLGHPFFNPKAKRFILENVSDAAKKKILSRKQIRELEAKVEEMQGEELLQFGILFGADGNDMREDDVLAAIGDIINTPDGTPNVAFTVSSVKDMLGHPDYQYIVLTAVLKKKKIFTRENAVYKYNGTTIATTDDELVKWLKDQPSVFITLRDQYLATKKEEAVA